MQVALGARPWGELVMHVLAHVQVHPSLPSSVHNPAYVEFVAAHLGTAHARGLAPSLTTLATLLHDHERLTAVQMLAARYSDIASAFAEADRDLCELDGTAPLLRVEEAAELLRASALLEASAYARLPACAANLEPLCAALEALVPIAPRLAGTCVLPMRPLGARGRLFGDELWIGLPHGPDGTTLEALAFQAAHEASVAEARACAARAGRVHGERAVEAVALVLLASRATQAGLADAHSRWYARWSADTRWLSANALDPTQRELFACCLSAAE